MVPSTHPSNPSPPVSPREDRSSRLSTSALLGTQRESEGAPAAWQLIVMCQEESTRAIRSLSARRLRDYTWPLGGLSDKSPARRVMRIAHAQSMNCISISLPEVWLISMRRPAFYSRDVYVLAAKRAALVRSLGGSDRRGAANEVGTNAIFTASIMFHTTHRDTS